MSDIAFVTGSASGLGLALTDALVRSGMKVVATDIMIDVLHELARARKWPQDRVLLESLDVRDVKSWRALRHRVNQRFGPVGYLFNVAGYLKPGYVHETSDDQIELHLDINVRGVINGCKIFAEQMVELGRGHIINIASLAGLAPIPGIALYSTSKFAVRGFSLALYQELKPHGVAVTVVCPDAIQTPMLTLQESWDEAALTFSGGHVLTVDEVVVDICEHVMKDRPMEVTIPRGRGLLAKFGNAVPQASMLLAGLLRRKGIKEQAKRRHRST